MKTIFPYEGRIDYDKYWNSYMQREDAIKSIPKEEELLELAHKSIVKEHMELLPISPDENAVLGDTVTMATVSELPKFNKPKVTASIGRGLYNKGLEEMVIGKKVGDSFNLTIQEKEVNVTILEIKRKTYPEPTDEMVVAMGAKDNQNELITTVERYVDFVKEEKVTQQLANINYYTMEGILADYPITEYDESDIKILGELEKEMFIKMFKEQEGIDLRQEIPQQWKESMGVNSLEEFINMRHEWYQMKIQQCLVYANILGIDLVGENDPLDHYEVLTELMMKMFAMIKARLEA